jgi:site-specific recombinase XerD
MDAQVARVMGKGRQPRAVPIGAKAARDLDRYLRARAQHGRRELPWLWLGLRGRLTQSGVGQMLTERARAVGIERNVHPHLFRHGFADSWLADGGTEGDLMRIGGWRSQTVMRRYGSAQADERARASHRKRSPADKLF